MAITKVTRTLLSTGIVDNSNATAITIDSSENVGIGTDSPAGALHLRDTTPHLYIQSDDGQSSKLLFGDAADNSRGGFEYTSSDAMIFMTNNLSEKMRIDSSGNLLVGTTVTDLHTSSTESGSRLYDGGIITAGAGTVAYFNRNGAAGDGTIVDFRKSGTTVGSIQSRAGLVSTIILDPRSGSLGTGITGSGASLSPTNGSGTEIDARNDIGTSTYRFKDLYLSGTANVGANIILSANDSYVGFPSNGIYYNNSADHISVKTAAAERMRIDSSGNVGIGETSPDRKLHVNSGNTNECALFESTDTEVTIELKDTTGTAAIKSRNDFRFTAGGSERMRIDSSGNVGIGTDSPEFKFHVVEQASYGGIKVSGANAPGITFEDDTDNAYSRIVAQNDGELRISADVANVGSGSFMSFRTAGDAERMRLDSSGNLLVGVSTFANNTLGVAIRGASGGGTDESVRCAVPSTGSTLQIGFYNANGRVGSVSTSGSSTAYNTSSDARLKDVTGEARGLEVINELNPVSYNWKADGKADEGLIAQEVLDIVPNAVTGSEEDMYSMDYSKLVVHLVAGMKEQQTIIDDLKTRIETLENV
jgi:hypothetical protein